MTFAIQQAPMHRAMDEVFGEGAHDDGGNRGADETDHVEHAIVPWFKCWADRYCSGPSWRPAYGPPQQIDRRAEIRTHSNAASARVLSKLRRLEAGRAARARPMDG